MPIIQPVLYTLQMSLLANPLLSMNMLRCRCFKTSPKLGFNNPAAWTFNVRKVAEKLCHKLDMNKNIPRANHPTNHRPHRPSSSSRFPASEPTQNVTTYYDEIFFHGSFGHAMGPFEKQLCLVGENSDLSHVG